MRCILFTSSDSPVMLHKFLLTPWVWVRGAIWAACFYENLSSTSTATIGPRRDFVGHGLDGAEQLRRAGTVQVRCFHRFLLGANMTVFRNFPYSKSKPARIWSNIHQHLTYILRKHRRGSVTWNASKTTRRSSPDGWLVPPLRAPPRPTKTARRGMSGFSFVKFALPGLKSPFFTHVWHILIFMYIYIYLYYMLYIFIHLCWTSESC